MKAISWYKDLSDGRRRREYGCFLVEGSRAVEQVLTVAPESIEELLVAGNLLNEYKSYSCRVRMLTDRQLRSVCASKTPQGVAAVVKIPKKSYTKELPQPAGERLLLLEGVQDPGNVGTLIRTAAAFDFGGVVLSETCADPFSPKAVQASAGSIMSISIRRSGRYLDVAKDLKQRGYKLIAADVRGEQLTDSCRLSPQRVLTLGSEGKGLSKELLALADKKLRIPVHASKAESLNVAAAGAILMFYFSFFDFTPLP